MSLHNSFEIIIILMHVARMHVASFLKVEEGNLIQGILTSNKKKEVLYSRNLENLHPWGWVRGEVCGAKKVSSAYNFDLTFYFPFSLSYLICPGGGGGDLTIIQFYIQYVNLRKISSAGKSEGAPAPPLPSPNVMCLYMRYLLMFTLITHAY